MSLYNIFSAASLEKFMEMAFLLKADSRKPVFNCLTTMSCGEFRCMLDSGASIPVWCSGEEQLVETFPKAKLEEDVKYILGGFGREFELAKVYRIPAMVLNSGMHSITFYNTYLPVVSKDRFGANLIMPSSFFGNANIVISQMEALPEKQLILQCRSFRYEMKFTKTPVTADVLGRLAEEGISGVSLGENILGVAGEVDPMLAQFGGLTKVIEDSPEEDVVHDDCQQKQPDDVLHSLEAFTDE